MIVAVIAIALSVAFCGFVLWRQERRDEFWRGMVQDLLNRKMARDFYEYGYHTSHMAKIRAARNAQQVNLFEEPPQTESEQESGVPNFISQSRPVGGGGGLRG